MSDEALGAQEEKWLKRERDLLEKNLNAVKMKEQTEEMWKRDRQIMIA